MTLFQAMQRGAFALGTFALVTAGSVALTRALTAERIEAHKLAYQHRQLKKCFPRHWRIRPLPKCWKAPLRFPIPKH